MAKRQTSKKRQPSYKEISIMAAFQAMQSVSPRLASLFAFQLWFHPGRKSAQKIRVFAPEGVSARQLTINKKNVRYWTAGNGASIFLMHGWASCGNQMGEIGQALLNQGYKIIWMDAPAHGVSSGWQTSLFEISESILAVQNREGHFDTVLAHSFGVPSCLYALQQGLVAKKIIAISAPATFEGLVEKFCKILKANQKTQVYLLKRVNDFLGEITMSGISAQFLAKGLTHKSLVIHDKHDRFVRSSEGRAVQENLQNSRFLLTEKLGHNKVLSDPETVRHCVDFIQEGTDTDELMSA